MSTIELPRHAAARATAASARLEVRPSAAMPTTMTSPPATSGSARRRRRTSTPAASAPTSPPTPIAAFRAPVPAAPSRRMSVAMTTVRTPRPPNTKPPTALMTTRPAKGRSMLTGAAWPATAGRRVRRPGSSRHRGRGRQRRDLRCARGQAPQDERHDRERGGIEQEGQRHAAGGQDDDAADGRPDGEGQAVQRSPGAVGGAEFGLVTHQAGQVGADGRPEERRETGGQDGQRHDRAGGVRPWPPGRP